MAIQYSGSDRQPVNNGGLRNSSANIVRVSGSTTTIERPTGGSVTQSGSGINTDVAQDGVYTNTENPAYGGTAQTSRPQTTTNPISGSRGGGSTVSVGFSGGGGGSVSGNADSPTAVNPQTRQTGISFNPLYLVLIPLFLLALKKK
jgi:hypothetical protein